MIVVFVLFFFFAFVGLVGWLFLGAIPSGISLAIAGLLAFIFALDERQKTLRLQPGAEPQRRWSIAALALGALMVLLGIAGLELAANLKPTASNVFSNGGSVLEADEYAVLRLVSWVTLILGAVVAIAGLMGLTSRPSSAVRAGSFAPSMTQPAPAESGPAATVFCESCGHQLRSTDRFCARCGADQSAPQPV